MTIADLSDILNAISGFSGKVAYSAFPVGSAPALPYIAYAARSSANILADDTVLVKRSTYEVELYTETKSPGTESLVEDALSDAGLIWEKEEDYLDSERCYMITFTITT